MPGKTKISWTDASWNPTVGCSKISPGCDRCYAVNASVRMVSQGNSAYEGVLTEDYSDWSGRVNCIPERLDQPLRWAKPRMVFVNSMSDLFHPEVLKAMYQPPNYISQIPFLAEVFAVMVMADRHIFQILTKRPPLMAATMRHAMFKLDVNAMLLAHGVPVMPGGMSGPDTPWPQHIWCGTSIESPKYMFRARQLANVPAVVRFLSLEPLLEPMPHLNLGGISWVIVGGESQAGARPMKPDWVRDIRDQCVAAGVPLFVKQMGSVWTRRGGAGTDPSEWDEDLRIQEWPSMVKLEPLQRLF